MKEIMDLNGKIIEVTDLEESIRQVELFMGYKHEVEGFEEFDGGRQRYWTDLYRKLWQLKNREDEK